uniref:Odorant-binding protein 7 n=1 Tax=Encarsia formosa TaxID=32400 RepID=A0A514TTW1_ENCFO|nr:odorant-binding protein 7 [Encarsia formosa]
MKLALFTLGILSILEQTVCDEKLQAGIEKCTKETGLAAEKLSGPQDINDPVMKCFMACLSEVMGVMKDGKIIESVFLEEIANFYPDADSSFQTNVKECVARGNAQADKCDAIATAKECVVEVAGEHGGLIKT